LPTPYKLPKSRRFTSPQKIRSAPGKVLVERKEETTAHPILKLDIEAQRVKVPPGKV
jgi:hypothetical protein